MILHLHVSEYNITLNLDIKDYFAVNWWCGLWIKVQVHADQYKIRKSRFFPDRFYTFGRITHGIAILNFLWSKCSYTLECLHQLTFQFCNDMFYAVGARGTHKIPSHSEESNNREATSTMSTSSSAQWSPSEGSGNIRHHLQMYWNSEISPRLVYLQCRVISLAGPCCNGGETCVADCLRTTLCSPWQGYQAWAEWPVTWTLARAGGGLRTSR